MQRLPPRVPLSVTLSPDRMQGTLLVPAFVQRPFTATSAISAAPLSNRETRRSAIPRHALPAAVCSDWSIREWNVPKLREGVSLLVGGLVGQGRRQVVEVAQIFRWNATVHLDNLASVGYGCPGGEAGMAADE